MSRCNTCLTEFAEEEGFSPSYCSGYCAQTKNAVIDNKYARIRAEHKIYKKQKLRRAAHV